MALAALGSLSLSTRRLHTPLRPNPAFGSLTLQTGIDPVTPAASVLKAREQQWLLNKAIPMLQKLDEQRGRSYTAQSLVNQVYQAVYPRERGVIIYGGSRAKPSDPEYTLAYQLGQTLAKDGYYVVSGGGKGVMEAVAQGSRDVGGHAMGAGFSQFKESNTQLHREFVLHQSAISDRIYGAGGYEQRGAYTVVFPGKIGTEIELKQKLIELYTLATPYPSQRQLILVDVNQHFSQGFVKSLEDDITKGEAYPGLRPLITLASSVPEIVRAIKNPAIRWTPGLSRPFTSVY